VEGAYAPRMSRQERRGVLERSALMTALLPMKRHGAIIKNNVILFNKAKTADKNYAIAA
jgi:hypothetical protein